MTTYFHCAQIPLAPGSVIEPGNWGRVIRTYQCAQGQVNITAFREALLELSRKLYAPDKPSRLDAVFVFPTLAEAVVFRDESRPTDIIYEVEPTGPISANTHTGDWRKVIQPYTGFVLQAILEQSAQYWADQDAASPEILLPCSIRIIRMVP